ncbi:Glutamate receptor ionotropic, kainate 4 [Frankliniella fusca]|uniref:Glutamate receptor ionotropic, kainate 4 n=1 Tax=Frankliniella fusca TaxID=407009 RepID=A0AAE1HUE9_9NEOP|nr:Glutamate receptor ionotropic, kainate 4 [Frankliniella fusca]
MRAAGLVNILLTGVCLTPDYGKDRINNTLKREVEFLTDNGPPPQDVCLIPGKEVKNILVGKKLTIATWEDWPTSGTRKNERGETVGDGFAFEFVDILREKFRFSYEVITPDKNILGDKKSGIFGLLYTKQADMAAALLPVMPSTLQLAQPSISLGETEFVILMGRPKASATGSGLLAPFTETVWYLILVSLILVGPVIFVIIKIRNRLLRRRRPLLVPEDPDGVELEDYSLPACVWFVYGALMKQGSTLSPRTDSTRMLFATWWLFILVLTAYYTANLTAFLTLSKFTLPIEGPKDIRRGYRWFAERGRILENAMLMDGRLEELQPRTFEDLPYENVSREEKIMELVKDKSMVFLEERRKVEYLMFRQYVRRTEQKIKEAERCVLAMTPKTFSVVTLAFFYPFNSSLAQLFDRTLLSLLEGGIIKYRQRLALPLNQICPLDLGSKERTLRNNDLYSTYAVIGSGFVAAIVAFVSEFIVLRHQRKRALERAASAQRKLLGSPINRSPMEPPIPSRKRVRLKIPMGPRYPGDVSHVLVLPPGPGGGGHGHAASVKMGHLGPKAQFYPTSTPSEFIFR